MQQNFLQLNQDKIKIVFNDLKAQREKLLSKFGFLKTDSKSTIKVRSPTDLIFRAHMKSILYQKCKERPFLSHRESVASLFHQAGKCVTTLQPNASQEERFKLHKLFK